MKKLAAAIAFIALCGMPAFAADMAVKAPPPASAPLYSWTGFYVGANAGYGWKDPTVTLVANDFNVQGLTCPGGIGSGTCVPPASFTIGGALGGFQAGYNLQISRAWLLGVETDFDWSGIRGSGTSNFALTTGVGPFPSNFQVSQNVDWFGTIRGRVGFLPADTLLLYATGGVAYGRVRENAAIISSTAPGNNSTSFPFAYSCSGLGPAFATCFVGGAARTGWGPTIGAGAEYALGNRLSIKAEYLYVNLGHGSSVDVVAVTTAGLGPSASSFTASYSTVDFHVVRGGVNYKF